MNLVDSHSHLFLEEFAEDLPLVIGRAREAGVTHIFMPNIDSTTIRPMLEVCRAYPGYCFPMIGLHPTSVRAEDYRQELEVVRRELAAPNSYVAVGEIGMDLYWDKTYLEEQREALVCQLDWALQYRLPVVLHCREAFPYIYKVLLDYRDTPLAGVFHSFTGTREEAEAILELPNFRIGVNGVVTFKKSHLSEVLPSIPLERLLLETDSPYLTPVPHRGERNESAFVAHTLQKVAQVYGLPAAQVAEVTSANALKLFGSLQSSL